jgi:hypothetical protein
MLGRDGAMVLYARFETLKDIGTYSCAKEFLDIMSRNDIHIVKVDDSEPVRKPFDEELFFRFWCRKEEGNRFTSADILFNGRRISTLSGMINWRYNLARGREVVNGIHLDFRQTKNDDMRWIVTLCDDLFQWSGAVRGSISDIRVMDALKVGGNVYGGLCLPLWVNYYGEPYVQEKDFHIGPGFTKVGKGVRCILSARPDDSILMNLEFLKIHMTQIGEEWFRDNCRKREARLPVLHSEIHINK